MGRASFEWRGEGGRGSGTQKCAKNGPIKFPQRQSSLFPTIVSLVWGGDPPLLVFNGDSQRGDHTHDLSVLYAALRARLLRVGGGGHAPNNRDLRPKQ